MFDNHEAFLRRKKAIWADFWRQIRWGVLGALFIFFVVPLFTHG